MKIITLLLFALLWFGNSYSQKSLYYNYQTKQIEDSIGKEVTQFKKNTKYVLYVKNYNPVLYKAQASVTQKNSFVEGLKFIMSFVSDGKIIVPGDKAMGLAFAGDEKTDLVKSYMKALELSIYLQDPDIDCTVLNTKLLNENELYTLFDKYVNHTDDKYKVAHPLPDELKISLESVMKLNILNNKMIKFQLAGCATELVQFVPKQTEVTLEVQLTPLDDKGDLNTIKYSKTTSVKGALYASFSTGFMVTSVLKKEYYINEVSATEFNISEENKANVLPGIVGLVHISPKEGSSLSLNVGVGLDIDKTPHFLTGLSFNFFQDTFLVNAGYDLGYLDEITDKYNTKDTYAAKPEISYRKNLVDGFWLGLTYKL